jgi:nitrite reductase/ring-hydroxylating ferredoxin subunit
MQPDDCRSCALPGDRRKFLRDGALAVAGILAALGAPRSAAGAPLELVSARRVAGKLAYPIPAADGAQIDRDNELILTRWQNTVYAFSIACPHQNTVLRWDEADSRFLCPRHHSQYRPDGSFIQGRATRGMDRMSIQRAGANVVVDSDRIFEEDTDTEEWKAAAVKLG